MNKEEINYLIKQGYSSKQIQELINNEQVPMQNELEQAYQNASQPQYNDPSSNSMFAISPDDNLVRWQLELDNILERVEHILRGDKVTCIKGNVIWEKNDDPAKQILNDYGVGLILRLLTSYLNRNTILSNYSEDEINYKVYDFGCELSDLFYMKYEDMGLDSIEKRKEYPMLVREIVDVVNSAYCRALNGKTLDVINKVMQINQNESQMMQPNININGGGYGKQRSVLNPLRYIRGANY